jgi:hypothetical protein
VVVVEEEEVGVHAVERWRQRRRMRSACVCGRAAAAEEEIGSSGGDLESFVIKSETLWGMLLFIGSKQSAVILNYNRF